MRYGVPFGYRREGNKLYFDEDVKELIYQIYSDFIYGILTINELIKKYELSRHIITNLIYAKIYRGDPSDFNKNCIVEDIYVDKKLDDEISLRLNILSYKSKYLYLYNNILFCDKCSSKLIANSNTKNDKINLYYMCDNENCVDYKKAVNEHIVNDELYSLVSKKQKVSEVSEKYLTYYKASDLEIFKKERYILARQIHKELYKIFFDLDKQDITFTPFY